MEKILIGLMSFYYFYIIFLLVFMFKKRKAAIKAGEVDFKSFKSYSTPTTEALQVVKNHIENQFQIPIIFMIVCVLSLQQNAVHLTTLILAGVFVLSRLVHSKVHLGTNHLMSRAKSYLVGLLCIGAMFVLVLIN